MDSSVSGVQKGQELEGVVVRFKSKYGTYLTACDDGKSVALVRPAQDGSIPKSAEWEIRNHLGLPETKQFNLWSSVQGKELEVVRNGGNGEKVVCQQNPKSPSRPPYWHVYNDEFYERSRDGFRMFCFYFDTGREEYWEQCKLCANPDGTVKVAPWSFTPDELDPRSRWVIEYLRNNAQHKTKAVQSSTSANSAHAAPAASGMSSNAFPQNQFQSPAMGWLHGHPFVPPHHFPDHWAPPTSEQLENHIYSGASAPGNATYINTGNNTNGPGTQSNVNNIHIKHKGPIYKYR